MKEVHVECYPDGLLVSKLGFTKKKIKHGFGKSRVLKKISKLSGTLGMVDEDPGESEHPYQKKLKITQESEGLKLLADSNGNKIVELKVKLEDWIISACSSEKIDPQKFGLPSDPEHLHDIINHKLDKFGNLVDELVDKKNPAILQLKSWLQ